jgi:hypothetical protein
VKCKACGFRSEAIDEDPETGKYVVELAWGRNAIGGSIDETVMTGYAIAIVDKYGRHAPEVLRRMPKLALAEMPACCNPLLYQTTVSGTWPSSIDIENGHFAVMPYQTVSVDGADVHVDLPVGTVIFDKFVDKVPEAGKVVNKVTQKVSMAVEGANACEKAKKFEESDQAKDILRVSYSAATGIDRSKVVCTKVHTEGGGCEHRLAGTRRLTDANKPRIVGTYVIIIPDSFSGTFQQSTLDATTFQSSVQTLAEESGNANLDGFTVSQVVAGQPGIKAVTVDMPTDGARPKASLAIPSIALILAALAGVPMLSM